MKQSFSISSRVLLYLLFCSGLLTSFVACKKPDKLFDRGNHASRYSSEVIDKWLTMQLRLMRTPGINGLLIGDPGTAKSALAKKSIAFVPRSQSVSGQSVSGVSLTAVINKEPGGSMSLMLGPPSTCQGLDMYD